MYLSSYYICLCHCVELNYEKWCHCYLLEWYKKIFTIWSLVQWFYRAQVHGRVPASLQVVHNVRRTARLAPRQIPQVQQGNQEGFTHTSHMNQTVYHTISIRTFNCCTYLLWFHLLKEYKCEVSIHGLANPLSLGWNCVS